MARIAIIGLVGKSMFFDVPRFHTGGETIVGKPCLFTVTAGDVVKLKCQNVTGARGVVGNSSGTYANCLTAHYLA